MGRSRAMNGERRVTRQLVAMSKIAWIKYRLVQVSLASAVVGAVLIALSGVLA